MTFSIPAGDVEAWLLLTGHRLAAVVPKGKRVKVRAWNSEDGERCIENISVSTVDSIDEYQLLCTNEGKLVLWDLSAKGNTKPVEFELEQISVRCGSVMAKRALRGYELNDAQPFRVNPEEGIVVVMVEVYPATFVLVIPTKAFTRFKAKSRVKWEEWSKFATKFRLPLSAHWIHAFHTHILCFNIYYQDTSIFDFSLYCREVVRSKEPSMQANYVLKGNTVLACQPSSDLPRPLAVTFRGRFKFPASTQGYPTENGVLFIEPGAHTGKFYICN